ncbi:hypothetical protein [Nocardioides sp. AE5]|uniref:hypothetical protein n=1 Tax=Nocardioides sp. AE5 TaxID=2962573 RepID=UPI002880D727|nr:hypothetical protein [Nocardioides sp. AE5]MDT0203833.1 hypothetical protein [Nocardioides sp. AE5]
MAEKRKTPGEKAKTARHNKRRWADEAYRSRSLEAAAARRKVKGQEDLRRARARLQSFVDAWKGQGCVDCGYDDIRAIDPDHRAGEIKVDNLSRMVQMCASADRIRAELAKCVPRCARCHRLVTQAQRQCKWRSDERLPPSWSRRLLLQDANDVIKIANGCADCGWAEWARGLDWDHVRGVKVLGVSSMIANSRPWGEILAEMTKCEVVCANCHRLRTKARGQYRALARG